MKVVTLILSIIIFCQSLSVCGPTFDKSHSTTAVKECKMDIDVKSTSKKSCCSKKEQKHDDHKDEDGCCGDNCQCLTCAKVFLNTFQFSKIKWLEEIEITKKIIYPVFVHSYDFHPSIAYPPNA